jgi:hypothetical protein
MIPVFPKATSRKFQWAFILFIQAGILSMISCHSELSEQNGDTRTEKQKLQQKLVELRHKEKTLQQEYAVARNSEPYLMVRLSSNEVELKAKGRVLRTFKVKRLKSGLENIPDAVQLLSEVKPLQKADRPKIKAGEGADATAEAAQNMLWGLHRMPMDYDLVCRDGMILEFRALPSEESGMSPIKFIKTLYRRTLDWYRRGKKSDELQLKTIQVWMDENDSRLLFWSLPKQLKILVIAAVYPAGLQPERYSEIQSFPYPAIGVGAGLADEWSGNMMTASRGAKPAFLKRFRSEAVQRAVDTRRATEDPAGVLDSTSRSLRERNAVDTVLCAATVEIS